MNKVSSGHRFPSLLVGQFADNSSRSSDKAVWVLNKNSRKVTINSAKSYDPKETARDKLKAQSRLDLSEERIIKSISELENCQESVFGLDSWATVAGYVASLFLPEGKKNDQELMKVGAAVLRARWAIISCSGNAKLILNDHGMAAMHNPNWNAYGYVFPLRPNLGLMLGRGPFSKPVVWVNDSWHIIIPELRLKASQIKSLNMAACQQAKQEVYGSSQKLVEGLRDQGNKGQTPEDSIDSFENASLLGLSVKKRKEDERLIIQLLEGMEEPLDSHGIPLSLRI